MNKADDYGGVGLEGERGSVYALGVGEWIRLRHIFWELVLNCPIR